LDGGSARRKAATYTEQHRHRINAHRHPCHEWDSNPRSQCSRGEDGLCFRPSGHCDRLVFCSGRSFLFTENGETIKSFQLLKQISTEYFAFGALRRVLLHPRKSPLCKQPKFYQYHYSRFRGHPFLRSFLI
jgi:hypothetical protein